MVFLLEWWCKLEMDSIWITATFKNESDRQWGCLMNGAVSSAPDYLLVWKEKWPRVRIYTDSWTMSVVYLLKGLRRKRHRRLEIRRSGLQASEWANGSRHRVWKTLYYPSTPTGKNLPWRLNSEELSRLDDSANWHYPAFAIGYPWIGMIDTWMEWP